MVSIPPEITLQRLIQIFRPICTIVTPQYFLMGTFGSLISLNGAQFQASHTIANSFGIRDNIGTSAASPLP